MKTLKPRKILSLLLALLMIVAAFSMTACQAGSDKGKLNANQNAFANSIGGVSETFKGAISEKTYTTSEDAAKAFVTEEVVGKASASITNVSSKTLNNSEIKKLDIPAELLVGSDAVEEMEVSYSVADTADTLNLGSNVTKLSSKNGITVKRVVKVYVIKFGTDWKYFSPMPVTGDTISKSYYDSVFNAKSYENCTLESTSNISMDVTENGENHTMSINSVQKIKHSNGKIYLEQTSEMLADGERDSQSLALYMETINGEIVCYVKMSENDDWTRGDLSAIGFTDIEQLTPFYDQYLDYTYFTKTGFGFELSDNNAKRYFTQALGASLAQLGSVDFNENDLTMHADYYVSNGVLSGMDVDAKIDIEVEMDGNKARIIENAAVVTKCTNYGNTVIERPLVD